MIELRILDGQPARPLAFPADAAGCNHNGRISTDGDAIRCCDCLSQLIMVPHKPGEFRLEWISPSALAIRSLSWAA